MTVFGHFVGLMHKGLKTNGDKVNHLKLRKGKESLRKAKVLNYENLF